MREAAAGKGMPMRASAKTRLKARRLHPKLGSTARASLLPWLFSTSSWLRRKRAPVLQSRGRWASAPEPELQQNVDELVIGTREHLECLQLEGQYRARSFESYHYAGVVRREAIAE